MPPLKENCGSVTEDINLNIGVKRGVINENSSVFGRIDVWDDLESNNQQLGGDEIL